MVSLKEIAIELFVKERNEVSLEESISEESICDDDILSLEDNNIIEVNKDMLEEAQSKVPLSEGKTDTFEKDGIDAMEHLAIEYVEEGYNSKSDLSQLHFKKEEVNGYAPGLVEELKAKIYDWDHMLPKKGHPLREEYLKLLA